VLVPGETMGDGHISLTAVLLGAAVAAAVSLLKGLVAGTSGNKDSASFTV
jgi:ABC-type nitrate/sulfonate/bicarbonate transport system permease component